MFAPDPGDTHSLFSNNDASAPTEWARLIWEQNPDSALVIRHGDDHVSLQRKSYSPPVPNNGILAANADQPR